MHIYIYNICCKLRHVLVTKAEKTSRCKKYDWRYQRLFIEPLFRLSLYWNLCKPCHIVILICWTFQWKLSGNTDLHLLFTCEAKKRGCRENSEILALLFMCRASPSPSAALFSALPLQRGPRSARFRLSAMILQHSPTSFSWPCRFTMMLVSSSPLWFCSTPKRVRTRTVLPSHWSINSASGSRSKAGIYWACPITWRGPTRRLIGSVVYVGWSMCTSTGVFSQMRGKRDTSIPTCCVSINGMLDPMFGNGTMEASNL